MNTAVGLDIGSHSIKLVELVKDKTSITVRAAGMSPTPPKSLTSAIAADMEALAIAVKKLCSDAGVSTKEVSIALPESQVFTRVIEVPQLSSRELSSAIQWEAEQYIPLPLEQVNVDFTVLRESKETGTDKMEVLLVAAPKALLEKYLHILELAGLDAVGAETEIIAASRALVRTVPTVHTVMVVSLGAQTTDLAILRSGVIAFTRSISAGGEALSRAVAQGLDFNLSQAEEFKKTYGVERDKLEGKIVAATKPVLDMIVAEMTRAKSFYEGKYPNERIETVLLSGGTARLPGMVVFVAEVMGVEAQLANPWAGIRKDPRFAALDPEGTVFSVAVGLALRGSG
ncbi:type IV pilus assembly protein PilM [Candidatus Gottesmanbacteria bacterium]|nr:type IV pilus assembly protein PilM [Candidatus Gottesmanbacteria bacterium]